MNANFKLVIRNEDIKVRRRAVQPTIFFKNKKQYNRNSEIKKLKAGYYDL